MTVNSFFVFVLLLLAAIFVFFKPVDVKTQQHSEVAQLDLSRFTLYELGQTGLQTVMSGEKGWRFSDRYEVEDINYTDKTKELAQNMTADFGKYRDNFMHLKGDVRYMREDGLKFFSNEATYNQKRSVARTKGDFEIIQDGNRVKGKNLFYQTDSGVTNASSINAVYTITEGK